LSVISLAQAAKRFKSVNLQAVSSLVKINMNRNTALVKHVFL